jgi:hypothetical protein
MEARGEQGFHLSYQRQGAALKVAPLVRDAEHPDKNIALN